VQISFLPAAGAHCEPHDAAGLSLPHADDETPPPSQPHDRQITYYNYS